MVVLYSLAGVQRAKKQIENPNERTEEEGNSNAGDSSRTPRAVVSFVSDVSPVFFTDEKDNSASRRHTIWIYLSTWLYRPLNWEAVLA